MKKHVKNYYKHHELQPCDMVFCEICGQVAVDIHHIEPKGMGGRKDKDDAENLIALCRLCHNRAHAGEINKEHLKGHRQ